jgi:hypothetical protein
MLFLCGIVEVAMLHIVHKEWNAGNSSKEVLNPPDVLVESRNRGSPGGRVHLVNCFGFHGSSSLQAKILLVKGTEENQFSAECH